MRWCSLGVVCTILFAGVHGQIFRNITLDEGSSLPVSVNTFTDSVITCQLETPNDGTFDFVPGDQSLTTEKYRVDEGIPNLSLCVVTIRNLDANDEGIWIMSYNHTEGVGNSQYYNVIVNEVEDQETDEMEELNATMLSKIRFFTRRGMLIDISLNKESFKEDCYVRPPNGELMRANLLEMENVTAQSSSNFVSCRITIGPMSEELLGDWRVCGETEQKEMRCQPAKIAWNNNNNPDALWDSIVQRRFDHPVHFGGSVNPGIEGRGDVLNCHVITPAGEDLVISSDVKFPHITRLESDNPHLCSIIFTDIDRSMLGNWSIYGIFRSLLLGQHEDRLPLNFYLYDENNPHEQAYNVTVLQDTTNLVNLGTENNMVVSGPGKLIHCQLTMPSGQILILNGDKTAEGVFFKSLTNVAACQITIDPVTKERLGEWEIIAKFHDGNLFNERLQTFHIIQEDPANPIIEEHRVVQNMTEQIIVDKEMGKSHRVTINSNSLTNSESCHILTPSGLQYAFIPGFNVSNVDIIDQDGVECGVMVNMLSQDMIGSWTLIARATRLSVPIETRLPFTIRVEESFSMGNAINISEGSDLYIRLPNKTDLFDTCKLYEPNGEESRSFELDPIHKSSCGYIVRQVKQNLSGTWKIVYGNQIKYTATVEVNVLALRYVIIEDQSFTQGSSVDKIVGPEDGVYCKLEDNQQNILFNGFGPCKLVLDRVRIEHQGWWTGYVNLPGNVLLYKNQFYVSVEPASTNEAIVTTYVDDSVSTMTALTCSVPVDYHIQTCNFRDPHGSIMVAAHGVGENSTYTFVSDVQSHHCTLEVRNHRATVGGVWRCTVNTDQGTYYGFLKVRHMGVNSQFIGPMLRADRESYSRKVGEPLDLRCSINTAIRYCYFRADNGTIFNLAPGMSSPNHQYVGDGFQAGDCGMRINSLHRNDNGSWSCHVGSRNSANIPEEHDASSLVFVSERMWLKPFEHEGSTLILVAEVIRDRAIEYCRFVRNDGLGFDALNAPAGYRTNKYKDFCDLRILNPTGLDRLPWMVAIKIVNIDGEFVRTTDPLMNSNPTLLIIWMLLIIMGVLSFVLGITSLLSTTDAREWTRNRASQVRTSFRNVIWRKPKPTDTGDTNAPPPPRV